MLHTTRLLEVFLSDAGILDVADFGLCRPRTVTVRFCYSSGALSYLTFYLLRHYGIGMAIEYIVEH